MTDAIGGGRGHRGLARDGLQAQAHADVGHLDDEPGAPGDQHPQELEVDEHAGRDAVEEDEREGLGGPFRTADARAVPVRQLPGPVGHKPGLKEHHVPDHLNRTFKAKVIWRAREFVFVCVRARERENYGETKGCVHLGSCDGDVEKKRPVHHVGACCEKRKIAVARRSMRMKEVVENASESIPQFEEITCISHPG